MRGVFRESPGYPYVALRRELLDSGRRYDPPIDPVPAAAAAPQAAADVLRTQVRQHGVGVLQLERAMSNEEFRAFGRSLGTPQPERSPDVRGMVEDDVILNLVTRGPETSDPARQPFAANSLSLHSESSRAPLAAQPRYIVLMCISPGAGESAAQTVVVPMADVHDALSPTACSVLASTRYDGEVDVPTILRYGDSRPIFSFRDFLDAPLAWKRDDTDSGHGDVDGALIALYSAMYGRNAYGFHWRTGHLVVIDNTRWFHGRTRGRPPRPERARHLKRLRVLVAGVSDDE